jgi:hypothetical protein
MCDPMAGLAQSYRGWPRSSAEGMRIRARLEIKYSCPAGKICHGVRVSGEMGLIWESAGSRSKPLRRSPLIDKTGFIRLFAGSPGLDACPRRRLDPLPGPLFFRFR